MRRRAAEHAVEACIKLQLNAIEQYKPDLIVGMHCFFGRGCSHSIILRISLVLVETVTFFLKR